MNGGVTVTVLIASSRCVLAVSAGFLAIACASAARHVELRAEDHTVVHVGEVVSLPVVREAECASACHSATGSYSVNGAAANLRLLKRVQQPGRDVYLYRATAPGSATFVLSPRRSAGASLHQLCNEARVRDRRSIVARMTPQRAL